MSDLVQNPAVSAIVTAPPPPPPPQVQNPAGVPDQIPNPPPQLQNMQQLPKQYQPTVPTGGGHWHQAVQALLGTSTQYRPSDPNNPNSPPVPYQVQNKPGNLFRSILAGAILGAGAGTSNAEHNAGSGWGAAGAGAAAVQKNAQMQQQQRQQQAQQQFENQQKTQEEDREQQRLDQQKIMNEAQIANWHTQAAIEQSNSDRAGQEYLDKKNAANKTLFDNLQTAGARPPSDIPPVISAYELHDEYMKTKGQIAKSPLGFHRIFIDTTSGDNVEFNGADPAHPRWVDIDTGKDVDMTGKTEFKVLDVPENTMNQKTPVKNSDVFKMYGEKIPSMDPNNTQMLSPADMITLAGKNREMSLDKQRVNNETRQRNIAQFSAAQERVERDNDAIKQQIQEEKGQAIPDKDNLKNLNAALKTNTDWLDQQYETIWRVKPPKTPLGDNNGAVAHPDVVKILNGVPGFDPQIAQKIANLSPDEMASQVQSSKLPDDVKNQILKSIGKPPVAGPKPLLVPNAAGRAVGNAVEQAAPIVGQAISSIPQL